MNPAALPLFVTTPPRLAQSREQCGPAAVFQPHLTIAYTGHADSMLIGS